jgi:predicted RecB family endonuclease
MTRIEEIINEYSRDNITRGCGHRAEDLFFKALVLKGFIPGGMKVREYNGRKWDKTDHDLDFVFKKDGVEYGCEIKNTLGYIDKEELDIKIEMCKYLNLKPLFIMRYSPKTYNKLIYENGGYAMIFETQIYELGQDELVKKIKEVIGLPVICSRGIPDGIIDRFNNWHTKTVK